MSNSENPIGTNGLLLSTTEPRKTSMKNELMKSGLKGINTDLDSSSGGGTTIGKYFKFY